MKQKNFFTWFLESLITIEGLKFYPSVIFTDESLAEIGAIKFVLPDVKSFRCDWHFQKDIHKKIATFHLQDNERNKIISFFYDAWYSKTETLFESCWGVFINYIDNLVNEATGDKNKYENIKSYFQDQLNTKSRWAHYYRTFELTLKSNSTQRIEGQNAELAVTCNGQATIQQLVFRLESIAINTEESTANCEYTKVNKVLISSSKTNLNNSK